MPGAVLSAGAATLSCLRRRPSPPSPLCKHDLRQSTTVSFKREIRGLPWRSSGSDFVLPLQGTQVQSLVREVRSCMPCGAAKK